jgi:hypothetical protein
VINSRNRDTNLFLDGENDGHFTLGYFFLFKSISSTKVLMENPLFCGFLNFGQSYVMTPYKDSDDEDDDEEASRRRKKLKPSWVRYVSTIEPHIRIAGDL